MKNCVEHISRNNSSSYRLFHKNLPVSCTNLVCFAAGTGITPIYGMINDLMSEFDNVTSDILNIELHYTNKTINDILLREMLDNNEKDYNLTVHYVLTRDEDSKYYDRINSDYVEEVVEDINTYTEGDTVYLVCGPKSFRDDVIQKIKSMTDDLVIKL